MNVNNNTDFFSYKDNFKEFENIESLCIFKANIEHTPMLTISIPTYCRTDTLEQTLESVLQQDGSWDYQIYVIDNNPERNDETEMFMQRYKGGKVSYFKNLKNLGLCGNWNRCISLPSTEWVCLLHDDDTIKPEFLNVMIPYLGKLPNIGILQSRKYRDSDPIKNKQYKTPIELYSYLDFYNGNVIDVPSGIIYNRNRAMSLGGFNPDFYPSLDSIFNAYMTCVYNTYIVNKDLTWYREGVGNVSKAIETQKGWFIVDYFFTTYILKRHKIPQFLIAPFAEYRGVMRAQHDMKKWGTHFELPTNKLPWKNSNHTVGRIINRFLADYVRFCHNKLQKF